MAYPPYLSKLIQALKSLPGVGSKSAERFAFHLLRLPKAELHQLALLLAKLPEETPLCQVCGAVSQRRQCAFCNNPQRNRKLLCVVNLPQDIFAIERTGRYQGLYHVFNAFDAKNRIYVLQQRVQDAGVDEVVLALDATIEAESMVMTIKHALQNKVKLSRLACGLPLGGLLEFVDGATLSCAFEGRRTI